MRGFWKKIGKAIKAELPVELVSVIQSGGSTPRGAGTMMAVFPDGSFTGTIGGGNVEFHAQKRAVKLLETGESATEEHKFEQGDAANLGMVCGGDVTLYFQYIPAGNKTILAVCRAIADATAKSVNTWFVRKIEGETVTGMAVAQKDVLSVAGGLTLDEIAPLLRGKPVLQAGEPRYFAVPVTKAGRTYVFGGGHVAQQVVPTLARVGFRPVVYDDRPDFANATLFPEAERAICGSFHEINDRVKITSDDYVVVMTRGHQADYEVLTQVLRSGAKYIGCIGSKKKLAACKERLLKIGFTDAEYAILHAPIGLPIAAETPAEIAVSVAAEMIQVRATAD